MVFGRNIKGLQKIIGIGAMMGICALGIERGYASEEENHEVGHPREKAIFSWINEYARSEIKKEQEKVKNFSFEEAIRRAVRTKEENVKWGQLYFSAFDNFYFSAGDFKDTNANNLVDWEEIKYMGKRFFESDERISFGVKMNKYEGRWAKFKLIDEGGKVIDEKELKFDGGSCVIYTYDSQKLKPGKYVGVWKVEGLEEDNKTEIEVKDWQERFKQKKEQSLPKSAEAKKE